MQKKPKNSFKKFFLKKEILKTVKITIIHRLLKVRNNEIYLNDRILSYFKFFFTCHAYKIEIL